ncbi:MAG: hydroxyethylthiazole kinase [Bacteroidales bacterium]
MMITVETISTDLVAVRKKSPLVHNITNFVVMNNTANALLAVGASPVMAHAVEEVRDMLGIASALVINMGTLNPEWVEGMIEAGRAAVEKSVPVIFDPVGAGATPYRNEVAAKIIKECRPCFIRGNASEIMALAKETVVTKGVDSSASSNAAVEAAKKLAIETGAVVVVSGAEDYITDGVEVLSVVNGSEMMARVTGMGCTATAILAAFASVNPNRIYAAAHAMAVMSVAGEIAAKQSSGNGSMQINFLDTLYNLGEEDVRKTFRAS